MDPQIKPRRFLFEYTQAAMIAMIFALFVRTFLFQVFQIPSPSMEDTLLVGDHILVNKFVVAPTAFPIERSLLPVADVRRGEVAVFRPPHDPERDYVKRIIGLPGDTIRIVNGAVYLKEEKQDGFAAVLEPYSRHKYPGSMPDSLNNLGPIEIPPGQYFVMGDNRDDSLDSREWGFVPRDRFVGRALLVYWSVGEGAASRGGAAADESGGGLRRILGSAVAFFHDSRWERSGLLIR